MTTSQLERRSSRLSSGFGCNLKDGTPILNRAFQGKAIDAGKQSIEAIPAFVLRKISERGHPGSDLRFIQWIDEDCAVAGNLLEGPAARKQRDQAVGDCFGCR